MGSGDWGRRHKVRKVYPGKVKKCNVVQERLKAGSFMVYGESVSFVLLFDTDAGGVARLSENLEMIRGLPNCQDVICIPKVMNLEDELKYACSIKDVCILTG